jgi:hypothetical protein
MRLRGQTLIETLVSLALLGGLFMLSMTLVGRLQGPSSPPAIQEVRSAARAFLHEPIEGAAITEQREAKAFELERSIAPGAYRGLQEVRVRVLREGEEVLVLRRLE